MQKLGEEVAGGEQENHLIKITGVGGIPFEGRYLSG